MDWRLGSGDGSLVTCVGEGVSIRERKERNDRKTAKRSVAGKSEVDRVKVVGERQAGGMHV